jgi:hypothetical protein
VIYLKAAYVVLQQSLGGQRLEDLTPLGIRFARTKGKGYPRIIPVLDRKRMAAGDLAVMRFWLTLFSIYRVIEVPGKLKLDTITAPGSLLLDLHE